MGYFSTGDAHDAPKVDKSPYCNIVRKAITNGLVTVTLRHHPDMGPLHGIIYGATDRRQGQSENQAAQDFVRDMLGCKDPECQCTKLWIAAI